MSKSDRSIEDIDLSNAFQEQVKPDWRDAKNINAFDTETHKGTVFMLSFAFDDFSDAEGNRDIEKLDSGNVFKTITYRDCRSAINVWYNLDFDANAILSDVLSEDELKELTLSNSTQTEVDGIGYDIKYVKGKFLLIKDEHGNNYPHYDISQFFYTSLDNAAEEWLGKNKKEDIDTSRFDDKEYIRDNWESIKEYAEKDAILTRELATELIKEAQKQHIPMGKPFSTGYLSAEYLRANVDSKPGFGPTEMQGMFWDSYYGGRFEVFERGNVGEIVGPDIHSAYPAIMQDLPDPTTLEWVKFNNKENDEKSFGFNPDTVEFEDIENYDYGVVKVRVTTNPNKKIQPFAKKIGGKVHYPVLTDEVITVIKPIFEFAVNTNHVVDYDIIKGWVGNEVDETNYPFDFIGEQYAERKLYEKHDRFKTAKLIKIVLNSLYGKTCQTTEDDRIVDLEEKGEYELADNESAKPKCYVSSNQREFMKDTDLLVSETYAGRRFNPFMASYITGMTRLELHKQVVEHDLVDDTVMFATDCIMVKKDAYEKSNFEEELINEPDESLDDETFRKRVKESLGMWGFDYEGYGFVVGSGVYEVERTDKDEIKTKTRGFDSKDLGNKRLVELAQDNNEYIRISNKRPLTMAEVLINPERGNTSEFKTMRKKLQPGFDDKRYWANEDVTFSDLLYSSEESEPIDLAKVQEDTLKSMNNEEDKLNSAVSEKLTP
jgi:hypothetical protein